MLTCQSQQPVCKLVLSSLAARKPEQPDAEARTACGVFGSMLKLCTANLCQRIGCFAPNTICLVGCTLQPCRIANLSVVKLLNWQVQSRRLERDNQPSLCQASFNDR